MSRKKVVPTLRLREREIIKKRYYSTLDSVAVLSEMDYVYHEVRPRIEMFPTFFFITDKIGYDIPKGYYLYVINDVSGIQPIFHGTEMMESIDDLINGNSLHRMEPYRVVEMVQKRVLASLAYLGTDEKFVL